MDNRFPLMFFSYKYKSYVEKSFNFDKQHSGNLWKECLNSVPLWGKLRIVDAFVSARNEILDAAWYHALWLV